MKNVLLSIAAIAIISFSNNVKAQSDSREFIHLGAKIGFNLSNVYDTEGEILNANTKIGFATGGFLSIPIGKYMGIQPEILFSQKGFSASGKWIGVKYDYTRTTQYLDFPILFAFKPFERLTLLAGPQYSYLLQQTDTYSSGTNNISEVKELVNNNIRKNTLCFLTGADIHFGKMVISGRVGWDISENSGDGVSVNPRYKNVWYQTTIGFRFF